VCRRKYIHLGIDQWVGLALSNNVTNNAHVFGNDALIRAHQSGHYHEGPVWVEECTSVMAQLNKGDLIAMEFYVCVQEKVHESLATMDQWDGLALSQQLSQVCLRTPLHHHHSQQEEPESHDNRVEGMDGNGDEGVSLADQENPSEYVCSQDFFW
jgi:hypothetical protein